jgi:vesicle transport through interaction with t-SNAREs protein 1
MANLIDADAGTELFSSYEAEFKLVQADLTQKLDQIPELSGEPRKAALSQAERALEEANELVARSPQSSIPPSFPSPPLTPHLSWIKCASRRHLSPPPPEPA